MFTNFYIGRISGQWVQLPWQYEMHDPRALCFEIVRYDDACGRVYHVASKHIAIEGVHLTTAPALIADLEAWIADPLHRTIQYGREGRTVCDRAL